MNQRNIVMICIFRRRFALQIKRCRLGLWSVSGPRKTIGPAVGGAVMRVHGAHSVPRCARVSRRRRPTPPQSAAIAAVLLLLRPLLWGRGSCRVLETHFDKSHGIFVYACGYYVLPYRDRKQDTGYQP